MNLIVYCLVDKSLMTQLMEPCCLMAFFRKDMQQSSKYCMVYMPRMSNYGTEYCVKEIDWQSGVYIENWALYRIILFSVLVDIFSTLLLG